MKNILFTVSLICSIQILASTKVLAVTTQQSKLSFHETYDGNIFYTITAKLKKSKSKRLSFFKRMKSKALQAYLVKFQDKSKIFRTLLIIGLVIIIVLAIIALAYVIVKVLSSFWVLLALAFLLG